MGKLRKTDRGVEGRGFESPGVNQLRTAIEAWRDTASKDPLSNRLFLDLFAVTLVKHFRAEEIRLERMNAPDLVWHRREHCRLVRQIWGLMSDENLGLEVTDGIHRLVEAWLLHQESASIRRDAQSSIEQ